MAAPAEDDAAAPPAETVLNEEAEAPTATATENEAGGIDLNVDLSTLQKAPKAALIRRRLLGPSWADGLPLRSDFSGRKILTLTDYKRRQGIA